MPQCQSCDTISELATNMQQLESRFRELQEQATHDDLTGASRRNHFFELARRQLSLAQRHKRDFSLLLLDLDHFKRINDKNGHTFGDQVLRQIAENCRQNLRESDLFGRYGGEEFVIALPETGMPQAHIVAERIRTTTCSQPFTTPDGATLHCSVSIGIASLRGEPCDLDALLDEADKALYHAKTAGRNRSWPTPV